MVFDDHFTTVSSIAREEERPSNWSDLCLENIEYIPLDTPQQLFPEWLAESDTVQTGEMDTRTNRVRQDLETTAIQNQTQSDPLLLPCPTTEVVTLSSEGAVHPTSPTDGVQDSTVQESSGPATSATSVGPRHSARSNKGQYNSIRYINEVFLAVVDQMESIEKYYTALLHQAELDVDMDTYETNITDARVYNERFNKASDPYSPTFPLTMASSEADKYIEAMKEEITNLKSMNTSDLVSCTPYMKVFKGRWAFKLKRTPNGVAYRYRSRFCFQGDQQEYGINRFETFAPVIQWSTVRLLLILILTNKWKTKVIDYTNAFPQAKIDTDISVEPPALFGCRMGQDTVLKLKKSLYGLKQSPRTFYQHLSKSLQERGWIVSNIDICLFMKHGMIFVIYVDDTIFAGATHEMNDAEMKLLGIK